MCFFVLFVTIQLIRLLAAFVYEFTVKKLPANDSSCY